MLVENCDAVFDADHRISLVEFGDRVEFGWRRLRCPWRGLFHQRLELFGGMVGHPVRDIALVGQVREVQHSHRAGDGCQVIGDVLGVGAAGCVVIRQDDDIESGEKRVVVGAPL